jgi:hypothetical protein
MATRKKAAAEKAPAAPAAAAAPAPAPAENNGDIIKVATELNTVLGLAPAIPLDGTADVIIAGIKDGCPLITEVDKKEITPETWKHLEDGGYLAHLKPAAAPAKAPAKDKKKPVPPKADPNKYTRVKALAEALKSGATVKDIAAASDANYVKNGGKTNLNIATWDFGFARKLLTLLGYATEKDGILTLK